MARRNYKRKKVEKTRKNYKPTRPVEKKKYVKRRIEVYGVLITAVSVLLFISVYGFAGSGIVNSSVNNFLSYTFGIGKFLIPFMLLIWGFSFFLRRIRLLPSSFGWGFFLLFFSILGILSNDFKYTNIFDEVLIKTRGGIIGAGIFYGLYKLFSSAGAVVVLGVLLVISILIITKISLIDIGKKIIHLFRKINLKPVVDLFKRRGAEDEYAALKKPAANGNKIYNNEEKAGFKKIEVIDNTNRVFKEKMEIPDEFMRKISTNEADSNQLKIPIV